MRDRRCRTGRRAAESTDDRRRRFGRGQGGSRSAAKAKGRAARFSSLGSPSACCSSAGWSSISSCLFREEPLADDLTNPLAQPLPDGIVPEEVVCAHRKSLGHHHACDAACHDGGHRGDGYHRCAASAQQRGDHRSDHAAPERRIRRKQSRDGGGARWFGHGPDRRGAVRVSCRTAWSCPLDTPVKFRLTSADVVHGFLLPRHQRQHDGGAGLRCRGPHHVQPARRLQHAMS